MKRRTVVTATLIMMILMVSILVPGGCRKAPEFAIEPQFDEAGNFSEGVAVVGIREGNAEYSHLGYIDKTGAYIMPPRFDYSDSAIYPEGDFSEGLAVVRVGEKYGYVDKTGKVIIEPRFDEAYKFSEGLAMVGFKIDMDSVPSSPFEGGFRYGYIDKTGKLVIDAVYYQASDFSEGLANVVLGWTEDWRKKWGYIDKNGAVVVRPAFEGFGGRFYDGVAVVSPGESGQDYGFIDRTGTLIMGDRYFTEMSDTFSEGLVVICAETDHLGGCETYGYVDKTGERPFTQTFDDAGDFSGGLAAASRGDGYGYIDKSGDFVISPRFDSASDFREGLAAVKVGDAWGYIDKEGAYVAEPVFEDVHGFSEGMASVKLGGKWGYIKNPLGPSSGPK